MRQLPIGSGQVESAVRRVVNLRFKAPGAFWRETTVSGLMHLRAAFKAGRWDEIMMGVTLQRHLRVLTKFAHVESRLSGHKRQREVVFYAPVNLCARRACSTSVAVGVETPLFSRSLSPREPCGWNESDRRTRAERRPGVGRKALRIVSGFPKPQRRVTCSIVCSASSNSRRAVSGFTLSTKAPGVVPALLEPTCFLYAAGGRHAPLRRALSAFSPARRSPGR
jgi:hypothetical protein